MAVPPVNRDAPVVIPEIKITDGKLFIGGKEHQVSLGDKKVSTQELAQDKELQKKILKLMEHIVIKKALESDEKLVFSANKVDLYKGSSAAGNQVDFNAKYRAKAQSQEQVQTHYKAKFAAFQKHVQQEKEATGALKEIGNKYTKETMKEALKNILDEPIGFKEFLRTPGAELDSDTVSLASQLHARGKEGVLSAVLKAAYQETPGTENKSKKVATCEQELRKELCRLLGIPVPTSEPAKFQKDFKKTHQEAAQKNVERFLQETLKLQPPPGSQSLISPQLGLQQHIRHFQLDKVPEGAQKSRQELLEERIDDLTAQITDMSGDKLKAAKLELFALKRIAGQWDSYTSEKFDAQARGEQSPRPPGPRDLRRQPPQPIVLDEEGSRSRRSSSFSGSSSAAPEDAEDDDDDVSESSSSSSSSYAQEEASPIGTLVVSPTAQTASVTLPIATARETSARADTTAQAVLQVTVTATQQPKSDQFNDKEWSVIRQMTSFDAATVDLLKKQRSMPEDIFNRLTPEQLKVIDKNVREYYETKFLYDLATGGNTISEPQFNRLLALKKENRFVPVLHINSKDFLEFLKTKMTLSESLPDANQINKELKISGKWNNVTSEFEIDIISTLENKLDSKRMGQFLAP